VEGEEKEEAREVEGKKEMRFFVVPFLAQ